MVTYRIFSRQIFLGNPLHLAWLSLVALTLTHCAPSREQVRTGAQAGSSGGAAAPAIALGPKDLLHVAPVTMPGITSEASQAPESARPDSAVGAIRQDSIRAKGVQGTIDTTKGAQAADSASRVSNATARTGAATRARLDNANHVNSAARTPSQVAGDSSTPTQVAGANLPTTATPDTVAAKAAQAAQATAAVLAAYGWDVERFASQLHAEIILRMRRQGIGTTSDSAAATAHLKMRITKCERDGGVKFAAEAALSKAEGARTVMLGGDSGKAYEIMGGLGSAGQLNSPATSATEGAAPQDTDPTLMRMQKFAKTLADEIVIKPPSPPTKPKRKRRNSDESIVPQVFMVF